MSSTHSDPDPEVQAMIDAIAWDRAQYEGGGRIAELEHEVAELRKTLRVIIAVAETASEEAQS